MKRDLNRLGSETYDLLVIGGGVTGACVARDAALRGIKVALVERADFAGATSAHNSKLIHGGLRYLRQFELGLVRESLRERRIWQRIAPHLVHPLPFLLPLYESGIAGRAVMAAGLTLYDLLSFDRTWLADPDQRLESHSWLGVSRALARAPVMAAPGFEGAFLYADAQMYAPERLALECLIDADQHGAALANYAEATKLLQRNGRVEGAVIADGITRSEIEIRTRIVVVAAGPWSDVFLAKALGHPASHRLVRSKGIHLLVPALTHDAALTIADTQGHFFVLPWRGHSLLGTTDTAFPRDPDALSVSEQDIEMFLRRVNSRLPEARLTRERVEFFYAGLRPLVDDGSSTTYSASRRSEIVDHGSADKIEGLFSALGGKWTTSRALAETVVDRIANSLGRAGVPCRTASLRLPGARFERMREFEAQQRLTHASAASEHLIHMYGSRLTNLFALTRERPELLSPLGGHGDIAAQAVFAAREEMALTLSDVVMRRTGMGQFGRPAQRDLETAANLLGKELGWTEARRASELATLAPSFETREAA